MDVLISQLLDGDVKTKTNTLSMLNEQLARGSFPLSDLKSDVRLKLINSVVDAINDSNPKVSGTALSCTQMLVDKHMVYFNAVTVSAYNTLLNRLCDNKIRDRVFEVLLTLINATGLSSGTEKLIPYLNHKNYIVRENVLCLISKLYVTYGDDLLVITELTSKIANMLNDSQVSVRQASFEILLKYSQTLGEALLDELVACNVKPAYLKVIKDEINKKTSTKLDTLAPSSFSGTQKLKRQDSQSSSQSSGSSPLRSTSSSRSIKQTNHMASAISNEDQIQDDINESKSLLSLVFESLPAVIKDLSNERELNKNFDAIVVGLSNAEDWQARINALSKLQSLATYQFESLPQLLRGINALMITQLSDLRSAVCKEAFRTVALLSIMYGQQFSTLAELWLPTILKQVSIKIQVVSQSSESCIRIIISSASVGFSKLVPIFIELVQGKNAILRKFCLECLSLACSLWSLEVLDKHFNALQQVVRSGIKDADQGARKSARLLYWVMSSRPPWFNSMSVLFSELDQASQKHIHESKQSPELSFLLKNLKSSQNGNTSLAYRIYKSASILPSNDIPLTNEEAIFQRPQTEGKLKPSQSASVVQRPVTSTAVRRTNRVPVETGSNLARTSNSATEKVSDGYVEEHINSTGTLLKSSRRTSLAVGPLRMNSKPAINQSIQGQNENIHVNQLENGISAHSNNVVMSSTEFLAITPMPPPPSRVSSTSSSREFGSNPSILSSGAKRVAVSTIEVTDSLNSHQTRPSSAARVMAVSMKAPPLTQTVLNSHYPQTQNGSTENGSTESGLTTLSGRSVHVRDVVNTVDDHVADVNIFTAEQLRLLAQDEHWSNRLKAFDIINQRLQQIGNNSDLISVALIDTILDLAVTYIADPHHKIATEAMAVLQHFVDNSSFVFKTSSKLSMIISPLFLRLADRRVPIRDQANSLLNSVRQVYDPIAIISALAPKIADIPVRIRTAVIQFLGAIVPHCDQYFAISSNTLAFLGRMANIFGGSGANKASATLLVAGSRLLELIYKVAPREICVQISLLPLQQQYIIKKLLLTSVPDIDAVINRITTSQHSFAGQKTTKEKTDSTGHSNALNDLHAEAHEETTQTLPISTQENNLIDFYAPLKTPALEIENIKSSPKLHKESSLSSKSDTLSPKISSAKSPINLVHTPVQAPIQDVAPLNKSPKMLYEVSSTFEVWLLDSLQPSSSFDDKTKAIQEMKKMIKDESKSEFWSLYTSQILSVLLESFRIQSPIASSSDELMHRGLTGFSPNFESKRSGVSTKDAENMLLACKALSVLVKYKGELVKNFMDLLVTRLCHAAAYTPAAIALHCEEILSDISKYDPAKYITLALPFTSINAMSDSNDLSFPVYNPSGSPLDRSKLQPQEGATNSAHVRLVALHTMTVAVASCPSPKLLSKLSSLVAVVIPSLSSPLADLRKAVIMLLVEVYFVIGDALYPYVQELAAPHRKLLTIYVEKLSEDRKIKS